MVKDPEELRVCCRREELFMIPASSLRMGPVHGRLGFAGIVLNSANTTCHDCHDMNCPHS